MKITDRLAGDHKAFRKMLSDMNRLIQIRTHERQHIKVIRMVELIRDHILIHAWCEDQFYYPAVVNALESRNSPVIDSSTIDELVKEHQSLDSILNQLEKQVKMSPPAVDWEQTYVQFYTTLQTHMIKEEEELFPESESVMGSQKLEDLSKEVDLRRSQAPRVRIRTPG